ncbi:MAG: hypothetical protein SWK76_09930 [Actinomycetota bacterium]|nr:hypothetical protein [Actinomycetota bacterium]
MAVWAMLLGMVSLINITMLGALIQVTGNLPDRPLLQIMSRYLKRKKEPKEVLLHPLEAAKRLARLRNTLLAAADAAGVVGAGLAICASAEGWGVVAMLAVTAGVAAGNLALASIAPSSWRRRVVLIWEGMKEEVTREGE